MSEPAKSRNAVGLRIKPAYPGGFQLIAQTTADDTTIFNVRHFHYLLILRLLIELYNNYK
jgi:hypothetical protein